jgi:hypothetical protein
MYNMPLTPTQPFSIITIINHVVGVNMVQQKHFNNLCSNSIEKTHDVIFDDKKSVFIRN